MKYEPHGLSRHLQHRQAAEGFRGAQRFAPTTSLDHKWGFLICDFVAGGWLNGNCARRGTNTPLACAQPTSAVLGVAVVAKARFFRPTQEVRRKSHEEPLRVLEPHRGTTKSPS